MKDTYELSNVKWNESLVECCHTFTLDNNDNKGQWLKIQFLSGAWYWAIHPTIVKKEGFNSKEEAFNDAAKHLKKNKLLIQYKLI